MINFKLFFYSRLVILKRTMFEAHPASHSLQGSAGNGCRRLVNAERQWSEQEQEASVREHRELRASLRVSIRCASIYHMVSYDVVMVIARTLPINLMLPSVGKRSKSIGREPQGVTKGGRGLIKNHWPLPPRQRVG